MRKSDPARFWRWCTLNPVMHNAELERERFAVVLFYGMVLLIGYLTFQIIRSFLVPLAWAGTFAMVLSSVNRRLVSRIGNTGAAAVTTAATFVMIVVPAVIVGTVLVLELSSQIQSAHAASMAVSTPARLQQAWELVRVKMPYLQLPADPSALIQEAIRSVATFAAGRAASILADIAIVGFQLFIMLLGLFYFLRDSKPIVNTIRQILPFEMERRNRILGETYGLVVATVEALFTVSVVQGALTGLTLGLLGFPAPVFWAVMTSFASLLPLIGAGLIWIPAALWLFMSGDIVRGIILVVVGLGVITAADQLLRPVLLSGRTSMHGLVVFISLLGGVAAFGLIGLVIGPVVMAAASTLLEAVLEPRLGRKTAK